jgi:alkylhydroperoxidase family enzyme
MSSRPRTSVVNGRPVALADVAPRLGKAMAAFMEVAYPGKVDLVTREVVRIYSGRQSHCRLCSNLRLRAAINRGFDESMVDDLDDLDNGALDARQRAAVRLARAFLDDPRSFDSAAQEELLQQFTPEQIAELILDLVRFRPGSKLMVASGTEPVDDELVYG